MASRSGRASLTVRVVIAAVVLCAAAWFGHAQWVRRRLILAENRAVELQNEGRYAEAVDAYQTLLPKVRGEAARRLRANLAACFAALAEDPARSGTEALDLYRKAYELDPGAVTNPAILKRITGGR